MTVPVITLITDFGNFDEYAGIMKGVIHSINPGTSVIDITHMIPPQNILRAAYVIQQSFSFFPKGSIHIIVVDPDVGSDRDIICMEASDHIFLAPDNGLLSILPHKDPSIPYTAYQVKNTEYMLPHISQTFHGRDIFAPVGAHISAGIKPAQLGPQLHTIKTCDFPAVTEYPDERCVGQIIAIDHFGNLITNITNAHIERIGPPENINIICGSYATQGLASCYAGHPAGELLAIISSGGTLEIACTNGNAHNYTGCSHGDRVEVRRKTGTSG